MRRIFDFGKIDYMGTGRKAYPVTVDMEYREKDDGKKVLSISGDIWNTYKTDIVCGGQCLDTIAQHVKTPLFKELYRLWKLYHLNDMHPECEHQAAAGWREQAAEKVPIYMFVLKSETIMEQRRIKRELLDAAINGNAKNATTDEQLLLSLEYRITSETENLPANIAEFYKLEKTEMKFCGWLRENEHSRGILGKPCPVCGYKYGHGWNYFPIPEEDKQIINKLFFEEGR